MRNNLLLSAYQTQQIVFLKKDKSGVAKLVPSMHLLMCSLSSDPETVQEHFLSSPSRFDGSPGSQRCQKQRDLRKGYSPQIGWISSLWPPHFGKIGWDFFRKFLETWKAKGLHSPHQASLPQWSRCSLGCPVAKIKLSILSKESRRDLWSKNLNWQSARPIPCTSSHLQMFH